MEKRLPGFQDYRFRLRGNMPAEARLSAELQRMNKNDRGVSIRELILLGAQVKERLGSPISTTLALGTGMPRQVAVEKAGDGTGGTGSGHPAAPAQEAVPVPAAVPAQAPVANDRAAELKTAPADATKALAMMGD